jgi:chemotaxis signal transduction protein
MTPAVPTAADLQGRGAANEPLAARAIRDESTMDSSQNGPQRSEKRVARSGGFAALLESGSGSDSGAALQSAKLGSSKRHEPLAENDDLPALDSICTFWIGSRCFGMEVGLASEVFAITSLTTVPLTKPEVLGLFNLRGTVVPLIDLAGALGLGGDAAARVQSGPLSQAISSLVLKTPLGPIGVRIAKADMVASTGDFTVTPSSTTNEHPAVAGFIELRGATVTILKSQAIVEALERLRFRRN